jgi:hypothetical protein
MLSHLHKTIENGFSLAKESPECFSDIVPHDNKVEVMQMFIKLVDHVQDSCAFQCLILAAMLFKDASGKNTLAAQIKNCHDLSADTLGSMNLFRLILDGKQSNSDQGDNKGMEIDSVSKSVTKLDLSTIGVERLIDVYLIGKSKRYLRFATALLIKSLYEADLLPGTSLLAVFMDKFDNLNNSGINSSEFLSLFGRICTVEMEKKSLSQEYIDKIVDKVTHEIEHCNTALTSHPNLDMYAILQKMTHGSEGIFSDDRPAQSQTSSKDFYGMMKQQQNPLSQ